MANGKIYNPTLHPLAVSHRTYLSLKSATGILDIHIAYYVANSAETGRMWTEIVPQYGEYCLMIYGACRAMQCLAYLTSTHKYEYYN
jgi:hypothetical protein